MLLYRKDCHARSSLPLFVPEERELTEYHNIYFCFSHNDREKNGKALPNRVRNYFPAASAAALSISLL